MDEADRALLITNYIEHWRPILGLLDWDIRYSGEKTAPGHNAHNYLAPYDRACSLSVRQDAAPESIEALVLHELLHVVVHEMARLTDTIIAAHSPENRVAAAYRDLAHDAEEQTIERLARAFLPHAPRVTLGKGKKQRVTWGVFVA